MGNKKILEINPNNCYFVVTYSDGKILKGNALSDKAWQQIPNGLLDLKYVLSNDRVIEIPKHKAYLSSIDIDGTGKKTVYYSIDVKCLDEKDIIVYRINLRQLTTAGLKIGDVIMKREDIPEEMDKSWRFAG